MSAKSFADPLWPTDQYELLDFGQGRKLERFGSLVLDRPCPAATGPKTDLQLWSQANLRWLEDRPLESLPAQREWRVQFAEVVFDLRLTPFGHVGLFPEHAAQWRWLMEWSNRFSGQTPSLLNLFAYTGGASLVLARHGWQVTHVDSSEPTVQWARHNALVSGLDQAPIRWLVEDARNYVAREVKRGRRYQAILLDPPSYGHGPKGKAWQIQRDLLPLLEQCCELLTPDGLMVLTGHSAPAPLGKHELNQLRQAAGHQDLAVEAARVTLTARTGRLLDFGWFVRSAPSP